MYFQRSSEVSLQAKWPIKPALNSSFHSMKQLEVFLPLPGWGASPLLGYSQALNLPKNTTQCSQLGLEPEPIRSQFNFNYIY